MRDATCIERPFAAADCLPHADAREGVRRHVQRVRRRGRDRRVALRGETRAGSERGDVVGVDDVVRESRVIGLLRPERLEDPPRLDLLRVRLVRRQRRGDERDRVEDLRLRVGRLRGDELGHRALVRDLARVLVRVLVVVVQSAHRADVAALALRGVRRVTLRGVRGRAPLREQRRRAVAGRHRIAPPRERDPPVRHRAGGVRREHVVERLQRRAELERVQQRHRAVHPRRDGGSARRREVDRADRLGMIARRRAHVPARRRRDVERRCDESRRGEETRDASHGALRVALTLRRSNRDRKVRRCQPTTPLAQSGDPLSAPAHLRRGDRPRLAGRPAPPAADPGSRPCSACARPHLRARVGRYSSARRSASSAASARRSFRTSPPTALATTGIYSRTRNPMYLSLAVLYLRASLAARQLVAAPAPATRARRRGSLRDRARGTLPDPVLSADVRRVSEAGATLAVVRRCGMRARCRPERAQRVEGPAPLGFTRRRGHRPSTQTTASGSRRAGVSRGAAEQCTERRTSARGGRGARSSDLSAGPLKRDLGLWMARSRAPARASRPGESFSARSAVVRALRVKHFGSRDPQRRSLTRTRIPHYLPDRLRERHRSAERAAPISAVHRDITPSSGRSCGRRP